MKSILGVHQLMVEGQNIFVKIYQADGIPEAGHFRYSMVVEQEDFKPYAVTFDGYESNRIVLEYNSVMDDGDEESENQHLEFESEIVRGIMKGMQFPEEDIARFFNCEGLQMVEGSLVPIK